VLGATINAGETVTLDLIKGGHTYLVPAKGAVEVNGTKVNARDGAAIRDLDSITVTALEDSEVVLVEAA
jgi:redox-sensitive bicupin YhaK (pirin superfamily)